MWLGQGRDRGGEEKEGKATDKVARLKQDSWAKEGTEDRVRNSISLQTLSE